MFQQLPSEIEEMFTAIKQNEGPNVAGVCREIFNESGLINTTEEIDWGLLVDQARARISPSAGIESDAQANLPIGFRGFKFQEDK